MRRGGRSDGAARYSGRRLRLDRAACRPLITSGSWWTRRTPGSAVTQGEKSRGLSCARAGAGRPFRRLRRRHRRRVYAVGDADHAFAIMSVSKPFVFALVCDADRRRRARERLGVNATGLPFNSRRGNRAQPGRPHQSDGQRRRHRHHQPRPRRDRRRAMALHPRGPVALRRPRRWPRTRRSTPRRRRRTSATAGIAWLLRELRPPLLRSRRGDSISTPGSARSTSPRATSP